MMFDVAINSDYGREAHISFPTYECGVVTGVDESQKTFRTRFIMVMDLLLGSRITSLTT
jgi:hypothetical protein